MARTKEEREQRRLEAKERSERRRAAKAAARGAGKDGGGAVGGESNADVYDAAAVSDAPAGHHHRVLISNIAKSREHNAALPSLNLPADALARVMRFLPAREFGATLLTCASFNRSLGGECRASHVACRLMRRRREEEDGEGSGRSSASGSVCSVGGLALCDGRGEARMVLERSLVGGGEDTGRLVTKKMRQFVKQRQAKEQDSQERSDEVVEYCDEYPAYARFVEEATIGYSAMQCSRDGVFPAHLQGRFASCSPEHTVLRMGGGSTSGPGGSGACSWGVGKRGQLGHGKREDEDEPRMLLGGIGWGVRIVQVAAGGGLVRVAHTLLLTSTGRVLSFGTAQYGQLGHGYDAGKQLGDCLRPRYVDALKGEKCICVAAGELHSGAVTIDGDVYTWGEGFCGQLGLGDRRPHLLPERVTLGGLEDECVSNMACGCRHTLVATEEGEVFSWGLGRFGVLGRSYTDFTYQNDVGMAVPEGGDEGHVQGAAAMPPPPAAAAGADAAAANEDEEVGGGMEDLMVSLEALNLTLDDPSDQCYPKVVDSLDGIRAVGVCAGHRHSMVLDERGGLYTFGSGAGGALGHGDLVGQEYPLKVTAFEKDGVRIHQMSAGVDISMAVSTDGTVYAWGKCRDGRIGLGNDDVNVTSPRRVEVGDDPNFRAVDVECGYVHSLIVGLDGSVYECGRVGTDGREDGDADSDGLPAPLPNRNIWHRIAEPKEVRQKQKWTKYGKYELKGRSKMMGEGAGS